MYSVDSTVGGRIVLLTQVQHGTQTDDEDGLGHVVGAWFRVIQALLFLSYTLFIILVITQKNSDEGVAVFKINFNECVLL